MIVYSEMKNLRLIYFNKNGFIELKKHQCIDYFKIII